MNMIGLDGQTYPFKLVGYTVGIKNRTTRSKYHLRARQLLKKIHPTLDILEEVSITIRKGQTLYLDFFLPLLQRCVEVHGEQHYQFSKFFHGDKLGFLQHKKRDNDKQEWCTINGIDLVVLKYDEEDKWADQLNI